MEDCLSIAFFVAVCYSDGVIRQKSSAVRRRTRSAGIRRLALFYIGGETFFFTPGFLKGGERMLTLSFADICLFTTMVIQLIALIWEIKKK